MFIGLSYTQ
ncbi:hypothetical protein VCEDC020_003214A, partial [Vibrio cholerae O1 str. EDC-020]